jgi:hypothetical protein
VILKARMCSLHGLVPELFIYIKGEAFCKTLKSKTPVIYHLVHTCRYEYHESAYMYYEVQRLKKRMEIEYNRV